MWPVLRGRCAVGHDRRAWLALEESGQLYDLHEVALYGAGGKPAWFLRLNPCGQVPVIVDAQGQGGARAVVTESEEIVDHVASCGDMRLLPAVPERAARWRGLVNASLIPVGQKYDWLARAFGWLMHLATCS